MKKNFSFVASNRVPARQADAIKHEVKKYIARERRKKTPDGVDFWEFDCKFGATEDSAQTIALKDINNNIAKALDENKDGFYLEVMSKPGKKPEKTQEIIES